MLWIILILPVAWSSFSPLALSDSEEELAMETISLYPLFHRFVEDYSPEFIGNLTPSDREILANQLILDAQNDVFGPTEDSPDEPPHEYTPLGTLELGRLVHKGDQSALYEIKGIPDLLIKYQANCEDLNPRDNLLHPLIRDYWYMRESFEIGLSPEPLFLSPASLFWRLYGLPTDRKFPFTMDAFTAGDCADNNGVIRYMIMRKSRGKNLHFFRNEFPNSVIPMHVAANLMASVIRGLYRLHEEAGVVHGDIHTGNIMVERTRFPGEFKISFIDFGRAFRDYRNFTNDRVNPIGYWSHYLCSPWQIDGREWARRDDVYKAVQAFAIITNPAEYSVREEFAINAREIEDVVAMKLTRFMFQMAPAFRTDRFRYISTYDPLTVATRADTDKRNHLINELEWIQECITIGMDDINSEIPYAEIIQSLNWIVRIVNL